MPSLTPITFGSLFAGIGGFDLGFERAGMVCKWQVEIDPFCRQVLAKHWPDVPKFEDVRDVGRHNLPAVDLVCGGFPCQDISNAGKRAGIDGERSGLWSEFARIICELRPRYVVVENVAALLVRGMGRVLGDLAEIGYDAEWQSIPASALGAPHRRDRVYIVAYPNGEYGYQGMVFHGKHARTLFTDSHTNRTRFWSTPPASIARMVDGPPSELDRYRMGACGNAGLPQVAEWIGRRIVEADAQRSLFEVETAPTAPAEEG